MSQSNFTAEACCSNSNDVSKDEFQLRKQSLTKLPEPASQKLNFLHTFDEQDAVPRSLYGAPSDTFFLQQQKPRQNVSFKSLPPTSARDSLENIHRNHRIRRYNKYRRRNLLRCFFKVNDFEKRSRRRLCQNRNGNRADSNKLNLFKDQTNSDLNAKKLRCQLARDKKECNVADIEKFKQSIKNHLEVFTPRKILSDALYRDFSYSEGIPRAQILFKDLNILKKGIGAFTRGLDSFGSNSRVAVQEDNVDPILEILKPFEKLSLDQSASRSEFESLNAPRIEPGARNLEDNYLYLKLNRNINRTFWADPEESESNLASSNRIRCSIDSQSKVDFSSGDDSRNLDLNLNFKSEDDGSVCKSEDIGPNHVEDLDFGRRSVQWNSEVDVIYYAGDTDGGKIIRREREPLREEADQQARRSGFIEVALNKNLLSALNNCQFLDPWITFFRK